MSQSETAAQNRFPLVRLVVVEDPVHVARQSRPWIRVSFSSAAKRLAQRHRDLLDVLGRPRWALVDVPVLGAAPGSRLRLMPSSIALMIAAKDR